MSVSRVRLEELESRLTPVTFASFSGSPVAVGMKPDSLVTADFNGDGKLDLAVANLDSNTVSILLGNGNGTFTAGPTVAVGLKPSSVTAADVNGDGRPDLAVANYDSNTVSVLLGNGNGTFAAATNYAVSAKPAAVVAADLNGDGRPDLAVAGSGSSSVSVLLNNGNGTFAPATNFSVGAGPFSLAAADLDGDGDVDLAVTNSGSGTVSILLNNGRGTFAAATNYTVGTTPDVVVAADLNGDGRTDLAVANYGSSSVSVLLNNGNGTFAPATNFTVGLRPYGITATDLDGDGDMDLAATNSGSDNISILLNNGHGTFTTSTPITVGTTPFSVVAADLDGDGRPDLAVANRTSNDVSVLKNTTTFTANVQVHVSGPSSALPGSQVTYTVTITNTGPQAASLTRFTVPGAAGLSGITFRSVASSGVGGNTRKGNGAVSDTLNLPPGSTVTYLITGTVSGSAGQIITVSARAALAGGITDRTPADLSASTSTTIANPPAVQFAVGAGPGADPHVLVYDSAGNLKYSFDAYDPGFSGGVNVAVGDVTGDGIPDIVTGAGGGAVGGHVKVFDGATGADIQSFMAFEGFDGGVNVAVGDVNGDGFADIIVGTAIGSTHVKVFSGKDGSLLYSFMAFDGFTGGITVAAGDVNRDGFADIIVGTATDAAHVKVFSGQDGSLLQSFFAFQGYLGGVTVAAGDIDGDGYADIAVGARMGSGGGHVVVFDGATGNEIRSFLAFPGFDGAVNVGMVDTNGDGRAELLVGAGPGAPGGHVMLFNSQTLDPIDSFFAFGSTFLGGSSVGGVKVTPPPGSAQPF